MKSKLTIAVTLLLCMLCVLLSVPLSAKAEEPADTAAVNEMLADTDSITIYGGNAEDTVSGRQLFSNQIYGSSFGEQLEGGATDIYAQLQQHYLVEKISGAFTFEPSDDNSLYAEVPADDSAAWEEKKAELSEEISHQMSSAMAAFQYDHPEVYWFRGMEMSWKYEGEYIDNYTKIRWTAKEYTVTPTIYYAGAADDQDSFEKGVDAAVASLSAEFSTDDTSYEKAKKIHDWINSRVSYNYKAASYGGSSYMYAHTPYPVFADKYGNEVVCEGYAKAFKILCDRFDIPCTLVSGMAYTGSGSSGEAHMWNLVKMPDEKWYGVDATWDDSGNAGYDTYFAAGANTKGFISTFSKEHVMQTTTVSGAMSFAFPQLEMEAYVPGGGSVLQKGDMNGDGEVNSGDLALMLQYVNKRIGSESLTEAQLAAGDVSRTDGEAEGNINSSDLAKLLQYINKRIDSLEE